MKGYKAFEKGMMCRGKQYAENTVFEESEAVICEKGMHFCKKPLDVLDYYPLVDGHGNMSEFAEVEALDDPLTYDDAEKYCSKKMKIGAKLSFFDLVKASFSFDFEKIKIDTFTEPNGKNEAKIGSSGDYAQIGSSGNSAQIGSSGYSAKIGSSGNSAKIGSSGYSANIGSSGDEAQIGSSGDYAQIGSSGDYAQINSTGKNVVICCAGHDSYAKGKIGSWITLAEWKKDESTGEKIPVCVKTERIDGERIKEDTFYKLINGAFVEVKE